MAPVNSRISLATSPIKSWEELISITSDSPASGDKYEGEEHSKAVPIQYSFSDFKCSITGTRRQKDSCFQTLVCHDLKGGYGDDRFTDGSENMCNYSFHHWLLTDIFVYFSHNFVTIPPLGWINAAHKNGTKILGTIITEGDEGGHICEKMLQNESSISNTINCLVEICRLYKFDGYLVNIENEIKSDMKNLLCFLDGLTKKLKSLNKEFKVIWYDSVIDTGALEWQNELNSKNQCFFNCCDGIYLNYCWNDEKLANSVTNSGKRRYDVYVGVDVFGRGCYGGGGLNTHLAVEKIVENDLSVAIFAPGWTFECHPYEAYQSIDTFLWSSCASHFLYKCYAASGTSSSGLSLLFSTNFSRGYGQDRFHCSKITNSGSWFNLSDQSLQPVLMPGCFHKEETQKDDASMPDYDEFQKSCTVFYDVENAVFGGGSLLLKNERGSKHYFSPQSHPPIWIPLDIKIAQSRVSYVVTVVWKSVTVQDEVKIFLEVSKPSSATQKILLGSLDHLAASVKGRSHLSFKFSDVLPVPNESNFKLPNHSFYFQKNNYDEKDWNGWRASCYVFDVDRRVSNYSQINGIKIGAEGVVYIGYISLAQMVHF